MFCEKCGKEIHDEAVICPGCGVPTSNYSKHQAPSQPVAQPFPQWQPQQQPITIVNSATAIAGRRRHSILFDIFMIFITGGLWIIWMIFRR